MPYTTQYFPLFLFLDHVILTALTIYANDEKKPLPTQEEVLVCNEETTAEQVMSQVT